MKSAGQDAAERFSEIYGALYGRVHAYAERRLGREGADEVAAETFLVAWRRLDAMPSEPLPWLYGVARKVVLRQRAQHARQAATHEALEFELERPLSDAGEDRALWEAWQRLSDTDREVLALVAWEERPVADAARSLGCSAPVFSVRLHRARKRLEKLLERPAAASPQFPNCRRRHDTSAATHARARRAREPGPSRRRPRPLRRRPGRRVVIIAVAALLLAVGAGLAATDPFGFFRNPNPGSALFGVDYGRHVTPPTAFRIQCEQTTGDAFRCGVGLSGRRYELLDHVESTGVNRITRANMQAPIPAALARHEITAAQAKRFDRDLAGVSDTFLAHLRTLFSYGTVSIGMRRVPPPGVPALIVCEPAGHDLSCRDLNGDAHAAIGSGIYQAEPAPDWRPAPPQQPDNSWALEVAILGHPPTKDELRLEFDLLMTATTSTRTSGQSKPTRVPARPR